MSRRLLKKSPLREVAYYILWCMKQTALSIVFRFREIGVFQSSPRKQPGSFDTNTALAYNVAGHGYWVGLEGLARDEI